MRAACGRRPPHHHSVIITSQQEASVVIIVARSVGSGMMTIEPAARGTPPPYSGWPSRTPPLLLATISLRITRCNSYFNCP